MKSLTLLPHEAAALQAGRLTTIWRPVMRDFNGMQMLGLPKSAGKDGE